MKSDVLELICNLTIVKRWLNNVGQHVIDNVCCNQRTLTLRGNVAGLMFGFNCFSTYRQQHFSCLVKSNLVILETSRSVILPPMASVLCYNICWWWFTLSPETGLSHVEPVYCYCFMVGHLRDVSGHRKTFPTWSRLKQLQNDPSEVLWGARTAKRCSLSIAVAIFEGNIWGKNRPILSVFKQQFKNML